MGNSAGILRFHAMALLCKRRGGKREIAIKGCPYLSEVNQYSAKVGLRQAKALEPEGVTGSISSRPLSLPSNFGEAGGNYPATRQRTKAQSEAMVMHPMFKLMNLRLNEKKGKGTTSLSPCEPKKKGKGRQFSNEKYQANKGNGYKIEEVKCASWRNKQ